MGPAPAVWAVVGLGWASLMAMGPMPQVWGAAASGAVVAAA